VTDRRWTIDETVWVVLDGVEGRGFIVTDPPSPDGLLTALFVGKAEGQPFAYSFAKAEVSDASDAAKERIKTSGAEMKSRSSSVFAPTRTRRDCWGKRPTDWSTARVLDAMEAGVRDLGGSVRERTGSRVSAKTGGLLGAMFRGPERWPMRVVAEVLDGPDDGVVSVTVTDATPLGRRPGTQDRYARGMRTVAKVLFARLGPGNA
jgi:hypothetical protein